MEGEYEPSSKGRTEYTREQWKERIPVSSGRREYQGAAVEGEYIPGSSGRRVLERGVRKDKRAVTSPVAIMEN